MVDAVSACKGRTKEVKTKKNLVMQKMPILTTSSLRSLKKKLRTQRGLPGLRLVWRGLYAPGTLSRFVSPI
jgi:hypothetical protein